MTSLSRLHAYLRRARLTREGATHRPKEVPTGQHKTYPRMERIALARTVPEGAFADAVQDRRSASDIGTDPLTKEEVGALFSTLQKHADSSRRMYPSGGALYPIETYFISERFEGLARTVFHYDPTAHALEALWPMPTGHFLKDLVKRPGELYFPGIIIFTALWRRSSMKYGNLAYQHALLEAGHMSQNVLLSAAAAHVAARPMAGFDDALIAESLDIDPSEEQPVHTVLIGRPLRP